MPHLPKPLGTVILSKRLSTEKYTVKANDTLWDLAAYYKTTVKAIQGMNNLSNSNSLTIGQNLILPKRLAIPFEISTYTVKEGDTLWLISRRFGVSIQDILSKNKITDQKSIAIGQRLQLQ